MLLNRMTMVNFVEGKLRQVVYHNSIHCAEKCNMFSDLLIEKPDKQQERQDMACFEKCIGKHTDSVEVGLE